MSPRFSFNRENAKKVYKVFLWTVASAAITMLISAVGLIDFPPEYALVVPIVNTLLYSVNQFINDQRQL